MALTWGIVESVGLIDGWYERSDGDQGRVRHGGRHGIRGVYRLGSGAASVFEEKGTGNRKLAVEQSLRELLSGEWVADTETQDIGHASWRRSDPLARYKRRLACVRPGDASRPDRLATQAHSIDDNARCFCCIMCLVDEDACRFCLLRRDAAMRASGWAATTVMTKRQLHTTFSVIVLSKSGPSLFSSQVVLPCCHAAAADGSLVSSKIGLVTARLR